MTLEILLFSLKISLKGHLSNRMDKYHFRKETPVVDAIFPFVNKRCHFRDTFKYQQFFSAKLQKKGNYVYNHPASNPEPLLLNIPFIPLYYQVDPPICRKILLQSVTFLNVNDRVAPNNK